MIYRLLLDSLVHLPTGPGEDDPLEAHPSGTQLRGAFSAGLASGWESLPMPSELDDHRLRFWFTEAGWRRFGLALCARARSDGHVVKVIRRKNPRRSEVAYRDAHQVALRPPTRRRVGGQDEG